MKSRKADQRLKVISIRHGPDASLSYQYEFKFTSGVKKEI